MTPSSSRSNTDPQASARARALDVPGPIGEPRADALRKLVAIVDRLRAPDGCPWDLKQTLESVAPHLVEEAHEVVEAVEVGSDEEVTEEAGDLLMGIVLLARVAEQQGRFDLARVAEAVSAKLVRRHPHVFGEATADSAEEALSNWEAIKRDERAAKDTDTSALAGVPRALSAVQRAARLGNKALSAGFRWKDAEGALAKVREEAGELEAAFREPAGEARQRHVEHELGDLLIAAAFFGNYVEVDPERAMREALRRFEARFRSMERSLPRAFTAHTLDEMMAAWKKAKVETSAEDALRTPPR